MPDPDSELAAAIEAEVTRQLAPIQADVSRLMRWHNKVQDGLAEMRRDKYPDNT